MNYKKTAFRLKTRCCFCYIDIFFGPNKTIVVNSSTGDTVTTISQGQETTATDEGGGFAFADGKNNQDPSGLRKGGRNVQWIDFGGILGWITFFLSKEIGKMGKVNPKGKGTNGGGPTIDSQVGNIIDAAGSTTDAVKETATVIQQGDEQEKEADSKTPEFYEVNGTYYNSQQHNKDGTRKQIEP